MGDDAKKIVLARRARFVALAIAGLGAAACEKASPCLSVPRAVDAPTPGDAGADAPAEASDASASNDPEATPPAGAPAIDGSVPPPKPRMCLSF